MTGSNSDTRHLMLEGAKVLVVDDDVGLCRAIELALLTTGADVVMANNGREGLRKFYHHRPDLVILDIKMPEMNGWETCRQIRMLADTPVIMLTTLSNDEDVVRGLDCGADDFLSKPFSAQVLQARTRAVLRRFKRAQDDGRSLVYRDDYMTIDLQQRTVHVDGAPIKLSSTEFRLLAFLVENANRVCTYQQILDSVWGWEYRDNLDYVHVYMSHLRRKMVDMDDHVYLLTERGLGYSFRTREANYAPEA